MMKESAKIVSDHAPDWHIGLPPDASRVTRFAARELRDFIDRMNRVSAMRGWAGGRPYSGQPNVASDRALREVVAEGCLDRGIQLMPFDHGVSQWCPADEFFDTHPDFFSLIDGKRLPVA